MMYTDEELLESLRQLADTLGETPTQRQCRDAETTPSAATYQIRFGSWNAAVQAASLNINQESYTDETLIESLREFADKQGDTPTRKQLDREPELPSGAIYGDRFDSWNAALEAAGLEVNQESFTDEQLTTILQEFAAEVGHTPSIRELNNRTDLPSAKPYTDHFESWNTALRVAGLTPNREVDRYDGTDEELLEMLREFAVELDTSPTKQDVNFAPDLPHSSAFARRFGGWNEAKEQAGLSTYDRPSQYTDAELLQELQRVAHEQEKSPSMGEMNEADAPCSTTYVKRFESWDAALEKAGLEPTQQAPTQ